MSVNDKRFNRLLLEHNALEARMAETLVVNKSLDRMRGDFVAFLEANDCVDAYRAFLENRLVSKSNP